MSNWNIDVFRESVKTYLNNKKVDNSIKTNIMQNIVSVFNNANGIDNDDTTLDDTEYNAAIIDIESRIQTLKAENAKKKDSAQNSFGIDDMDMDLDMDMNLDMDMDLDSDFSSAKLKKEYSDSKKQMNKESASFKEDSNGIYIDFTDSSKNSTVEDKVEYMKKIIVSLKEKGSEGGITADFNGKKAIIFYDEPKVKMHCDNKTSDLSDDSSLNDVLFNIAKNSSYIRGNARKRGLS